MRTWMVSWDLFQEAFLTNTQTGYVVNIKKKIMFFTCSNSFWKLIDVHPFKNKEAIFLAINVIMEV